MLMDMNLMLIIVQENDAESLASAFKRSQIQATRIDAKGLVSSRKLNVSWWGRNGRTKYCSWYLPTAKNAPWR